MKVLFSNSVPFFLAHGGTQTLIESLMRELGALGVEVEPERWWDEAQHGDVLHYFGRPPSAQHVRFAHEKGFRVIMTESLDQTASRSPARLFAQRQLTRLAQATLGGLTARLAWDAYQEVDAAVYIVPHEWETARYLFDVPVEVGHVIPHGLDAVALRILSQPQAEGDYLISVGTIAPRKNTVLLAQAARLAQVPIVFLGKPYAEDDPYFHAFRKLVDDHWVRYPGFVPAEEKNRLLRGARGFALLSEFETGCIALLEGAAAGLPFFLSDLPWATRVYAGARQVEFVRWNSAKATAPYLQQFHQSSHRMTGPTFPVLSWADIAARYVELYQKVLMSHASPR